MFSSWFHKKEPANPSEIAKMIRSAADNTDNKKMKAALQAAKTLMQDATEEDSKEVAVMGLEIARSLPPLDADKLKKLDFDNKKGVKDLFCGLLRQPATLSSMVERLGDPENMALVDIMKGYAREDIAVLCGQMLRECIHYEALAKKLLCSEDFYDLFRYAEDTHFDIAADALSTLRVLLTKHKKMVCEFLHNNKDFFTSYERLLSSESYIARRQSVKLLGEILLDHHNFTVMKQYIEKPDNLKIAMNLLRKKDSIAFEAFHVFKVFVANSDRPPQIDHILRCNKERLVKFLDGFCDDSRPEDEQFKSEKSFLIQQIQNIQEDAA
ncbi:hypothetical protein L596_019306 [Steinernema carpocapsae]|nr:hypothetical protein L596_019306 [Steinernema carpocapsae]